MCWFTARTTPNYLYRVKQNKTRTISRKKSLKPVRTVAFRAWTKTMTWWPFRTKSTTWKKYKHLFEVMVKWWVSEASLFLRQNFEDILIQLNENVLIRLNFNYSRFMKVDYFWPCRNRCRPCRWLADACRTWRRWRLLSTEPAGIDHRRRTSLEKSKSKTKHKSSDKIAFPNFRDSKFSEKLFYINSK